MFLHMAGCSLPDTALEPRINITSEQGSAVQVRVFLEGRAGLALDGALVACMNPGGESLVLGFSAQAGAYTGCFTAVLSGDYIFHIRSRSADKEIVRTVRHDPMARQPALTVCMDAAGNDALLGGSLMASKEIAIAWETLQGATVYVAQALHGTEIVWSKAVDVPEAAVPAGALSPGSYGIVVLAQSIHGDPLFATGSFYSVSQAKSATRYVTLAP